MKQFFKEAFYEPHHKKFLPINNFYAFLTIVSISSIILETIPALSQYSQIFTAIEYFSVSFFTLEYIGRLIGAEKPTDYTLSFFGIIDFLSVAPALFGFGNFTVLKAARILRIIRLLRTIRLLNIDGIKHKHPHTPHKLTLLNFEIYFISLIAAIIISATIIYVTEPQNELFETIPYAMLWSSKVILGSMGAAQPVTILGQLVMIGSRFIGLILFGLLITVIGTTAKRIIFGSARRGFE